MRKRSSRPARCPTGLGTAGSIQLTDRCLEKTLSKSYWLREKRGGFARNDNCQRRKLHG